MKMRPVQTPLQLRKHRDGRMLSKFVIFTPGRKQTKLSAQPQNIELSGWKKRCSLWGFCFLIWGLVTSISSLCEKSSQALVTYELLCMH